MRPFLVPPNATTPADVLRYYLASQGRTIAWLSRQWGINYGANGLRALNSKYGITPARIDHACQLLNISDGERKRIHRLAAKQQGWDIE